MSEASAQGQTENTTPSPFTGAWKQGSSVVFSKAAVLPMICPLTGKTDNLKPIKIGFSWMNPGLRKLIVGTVAGLFIAQMITRMPLLSLLFFVALITGIVLSIALTKRMVFTLYLEEKLYKQRKLGDTLFYIGMALTLAGFAGLVGLIAMVTLKKMDLLAPLYAAPLIFIGIIIVAIGSKKRGLFKVREMKNDHLFVPQIHPNFRDHLDTYDQ